MAQEPEAPCSGPPLDLGTSRGSLLALPAQVGLLEVPGGVLAPPGGCLLPDPDRGLAP